MSNESMAGTVRSLSSPRTIALAFALGVLSAACSETRPLRGDARDDIGGTRSTTAIATDGPAPDVARLRADVAWLADDAREGRRAGTEQGRLAGEWIAARCKQIGLEPAGDRGFLQEFEVPLPIEDGGRSEILARGATIADPSKLVPLFCSSSGAAEGELVFRGYGIVAPDKGWDDYADGDVRGKVVLLVRGTPGGPEATTSARTASDPHGAGVSGADPHGAAAHGADVQSGVAHGTDSGSTDAHGHGANGSGVHGTDAHGSDPHGAAPGDTALVTKGGGWGNAGSLFTKVMEAKRRGAVAVLVGPAPESFGEALTPFDASRSANASIPALLVSGDVAVDLAAAGAPADRRAKLYGELVRSADGESAASLSSSTTVDVRADVVRARGPAANVLARLPGRDRSRTVVVGAHYDHLGHGGDGSLAPKETGSIHNGADDNASGTAVVLEIARLLKQQGPPPCDVVFALWSGEELGLLGSEHWGEQPTVPLDQVVANLNLDMVGRAGSGKLQVLGAGTAQEFASWMDGASDASGLELVVSTQGGALGGSSDHQAFLKRKIPALHLFSGLHPDYHKPSDDADKFEAEGAAKVARLGVDLVLRMAAAPRLAFEAPAVDDKDRPQIKSGFRAWFGSLPNYAYDGKGVKIDGTSPGSPAERASFLAGDVLLKMGEIEIANIYDFMYGLELYKPGDVVLVRFARDGAEQETRVTLASRQQE